MDAGGMLMRRAKHGSGLVGQRNRAKANGSFRPIYEFAEGFTFELSYLFWSRLKVGEKVELKKVLAHRDVQHELFWKARQLAER
jgi:hypothetical protein